MRAALGDEARGLRLEVGELPRRVGDRIGRNAAAAAAIVELVADRILLRLGQHVLDLERLAGETADVRLRRDVDPKRPDPPVGTNVPRTRPGAAARCCNYGGHAETRLDEATDGPPLSHLSHRLHMRSKQLHWRSDCSGQVEMPPERVTVVMVSGRTWTGTPSCAKGPPQSRHRLKSPRCEGRWAGHAGRVSSWPGEYGSDPGRSPSA